MSKKLWDLKKIKIIFLIKFTFRTWRRRYFCRHYLFGNFYFSIKFLKMFYVKFSLNEDTIFHWINGKKKFSLWIKHVSYVIMGSIRCLTNFKTEIFYTRMLFVIYHSIHKENHNFWELFLRECLLCHICVLRICQMLYLLIVSFVKCQIRCFPFE